MEIINIIATFFFSTIIILISQKIFISKKYTDEIIVRSSHSVIATRSGGLSIYISIFIVSFFYYVSGYSIFDYSILVPLSLLMFLGLYDDIKNIDFKLKFVFQIIAAKIIIDNGLIIDNFHGLFGIFELNRIIAQLFTIFIVIAIVNSINFIDGIDGLAISIIILFIVLFEFFSDEITPFITFSTILLASLVPLYYFNFRNKNKVFLGDSGSLFLGGVVSIYVIYTLTNNYIIKPEFDMHKMAFVISILFYPIIDIIRVFTIRVSKNKSPFIADKNHIHHIFLKKINKHVLVVALIISISILFVIMAQVINKM
jgi:UDP-N-acetylmuramyl pentapeptide phosphotransferase/UDP-N-acetylglucosamine-1-phosphate transferase